MGYGNLLLLLIYTLTSENEERGGGGVRKGATERKQKHVCMPRYIFVTLKVIFRRASGQ